MRIETTPPWFNRLTALLSLLAMTALPNGNAAPADTSLKQLARDNAAFASILFTELSRTEGNLFFSPHSISTALAMTYAGARGNSAAEMASALHFSQPPESLHASFGQMASALVAAQKAGQIELNTANSLWPQQGYPLLPGYLDLIRRHYGDEINPIDFAATEAARKRINGWVEERTRNRIRDLIPPAGLSPATRLVLANAIYFKGQWAIPFKEAQTRVEKFQLSPTRTVDARFMGREGSMLYAEAADWQLLELAYAGNELAMVILLPRKTNGLPALTQSLTGSRLFEMADQLRRRQVNLRLPRFKLTSQFRLDAELRALGMTEAFDAGKANFSGMDGRDHWLFISAVIHKAFVEVNEAGTEAAAATGVVVIPTSMPLEPEKPVAFRADHPFLFWIRHRPTGAILFLGRLDTPAV